MLAVAQMVGFGRNRKKCLIFQWGLTDSLSASCLRAQGLRQRLQSPICSPGPGSLVMRRCVVVVAALLSALAVVGSAEARSTWTA